MPHLIIEYSANLEPELDVAALVARVHEAALSTGIFPLGGIRTRAVRRDIYAIADGHAENTFVHLDVRIGSGRALEVRKQAGEAIFAALNEALKPLFARRPMGVSMELAEINPDTSWRMNNLHDIVARRKGGAS